MSNNKQMHDKLAKLYGNKCMFLASHCDEDLHYKKFQEKYSSKQLQKLIKNITVHHLKHRSEGGHTTIKNCSLVSELAHRYIHSLPREIEECINERIREYKRCKIEFVDDLDCDIEIHYGLLENGKLISLSKSEQIDRDRRKVKKEFERERLKWEDR